MKLNRRKFLAGTGAAVAAAEMGLFEFASSLSGGEVKPAGKPVVNAVFVRPLKAQDVSWPGGNCDIPAQQALFTETLRTAADKLGVDLRVRDQPIYADSEIAAYIEQLKKTPPDGLILGAMCLEGWKPVQQIVKDRGEIPTIIYSHVSGFTSHLQLGRKEPGVLMAATQSVEWLEMAVRMLNAIWRLKHARILTTARGKESVHELGTKVVPCQVNWQAEIKKAQETEESRAIAEFYAKNAKKIIEPTKADIFEAAQQYAVLRRLMAAQNCQGITLSGCLINKPPCLAASKLRDEGIVATCEGCVQGSLGELVSFLLFNRPTFIQDPSPNTINNTLIGAHCTSPIKLEGCDQPYRAPYLIRNYHTRDGVSMQVLWPEGKEVTLIQFGWPKKTLMIGTGRVVANIAQPPTGCCRTSVEVTVDGCLDTRDVKGFHQLFILGNLERPLRQFCQLASIEASRIY
jgi:hypothetical protein